MHMLKVQPMVVPPLPWRSMDSGGLLFTRFNVMRTRTPTQVQALQEAEAAAPNGMRQVNRPCLATRHLVKLSWPAHAQLSLYSIQLSLCISPPQDLARPSGLRIPVTLPFGVCHAVFSSGCGLITWWPQGLHLARGPLNCPPMFCYGVTTGRHHSCRSMRR